MRNSCAPRVVALVALSVFSLSDVAFGVPVCSAPSSNKASSGKQTSLSSTAANNASAAANTVSNAATSGADFGSCPPPSINFATGLDGRKETAFVPFNQTAYNHGSADNIGVISNFMCLALTNTCKANAAAKALCGQAQNAGNSATPPQSGAQADAFNAVMGNKTNLAAVQQISNTGQPVGQPASQSGQTSSSSQTATNSGAADFGSCPPPQIKFAAGLDGRKETAFEPTDQAAYNHGSADNIPIITQFMCDNLVNSCKANQAAQALCAKAEAAANAATPAQTGIQADTFNNFFGIKTDFATTVQPLTNQGVPLVVSGAKSAPSSTPSGAPKPAKTDATQPTTGNLQTFTGDLGGPPPTVTAAGGGKFQVEGNALFNDQKSAVQRSCDVQHNQCANAANASGNQGQLTVANCGTQQTQCDAAAAA